MVERDTRAVPASQGRARRREEAALALLIALGGAAGCAGEPDHPGTEDDGAERVGEVDQEYTATGFKWSSRTYSIKANLTSFQNNLGTLNLNSGQAEFWITYALSNWKERTGADITLGYGGTTTSGCAVQNNENGVVAQAACKEPGCWTWAEEQPWVWSDNTMAEADVCVFGGSATWRVDSAGFPAGSKDLVGVLAHEFGHGLGLDHTAGTVMDSPTHNTGNTLSRHPYGDDVAGIRALYGTKTRNLLWSSYDGTSWSGTSVLTSGMQMHSNGAMGVGPGGTQLLVAGHLDPGAGAMHFTRAAVPLSGGSGWVNRFVNVNSWRPPAVAARATGTPLWVAAWANATTTLSCGGIGVMASGDAFDSAWLLGLPTDCTLHEPALVHDNSSGRVVLIYTSLQSGSSQANNGRMYARTSTDGVNWTAAQDLGIYTIDAPRTACGMGGQCLLTYVAGGVDPWLMNTQFTVNASTGAVAFGGTSWNYNYVQRTPPVAVVQRVSWSWEHEFVVGLQWTGSANDRANGVGGVWTAESTTAPVPGFGWVGTGQWLDHRADLVGSPNRLYPMYALTTAM